MLERNQVLEIDEILDFWFADIGDGFDIKTQNVIWYGGSERVDKEIEQRFEAMVTAAKKGLLKRWEADYRGCLALVILLDQFSRNIYRGSVIAFSGDVIALDIVNMALTKRFDRLMTPIQRSFFYMPFEHSESLSNQDRSVDLFNELLTEVSTPGRNTIQSSLVFAEKHRDIVRQFGRFPHRNAVLSRETTAEEKAYLDSGGARFGQ